MQEVHPRGYHWSIRSLAIQESLCSTPMQF